MTKRESERILSLEMAKRTPYKLSAMEADRITKGWNYFDLAREARVSVATINKVFKHKRCTPKTAKKIAYALGYPLERYVRAELRVAAA